MINTEVAVGEQVPAAAAAGNHLEEQVPAASNHLKEQVAAAAGNRAAEEAVPVTGSPSAGEEVAVVGNRPAEVEVDRRSFVSRFRVPIPESAVVGEVAGRKLGAGVAASVQVAFLAD